MERYIMAYDMGSTGCKTCLYKIGSQLELLDSALAPYELHSVGDGGLEQDPRDWWEAMTVSTKSIVSRSPSCKDQMSGVSFCAQMQGLVVVDKNVQPLRPAMSYLDQRAAKQKHDSVEHGIQVAGVNIFKLLKSLFINGAAAASVKDPVWKYKWIEENEPDIFSKIYKWLDVKDYLIARATGKCTMTRDSAFATFLTRTCKGTISWSPGLLKMYGVKPEHMPGIINSTDRAGVLTEKSGEELGLPSGIPVFGGGGDASMITIGAGATGVNDCYVYTGTSGWVSCTVKRQKVDVNSMIASIIGAQPDLYNFFAEQETAGKCLEWVKDHLAADEIDLYLHKHNVIDDPESKYTSIYEFLIETIEQVPPGAAGVIFTPWLHGNRSPFEDPHSRGIFFNLSLDTGKRILIRAVVEGIIFHQKWLLECIQKSFDIPGPLTFVGGGALSPVISQIMADILGYPVRTIKNPQHCGAAGAALTAAIGLGWIPDFSVVKKIIPVLNEYQPRKEFSSIYKKQFKIFKKLYTQNKKLFAALNS
ncbi:MAG: FGGY-family carbohydrate kinase [Spirochaetales bacterium]|nr:FGGY-family carbohydrate kinase [Spirochaetales bacterium]